MTIVGEPPHYLASNTVEKKPTFFWQGLLILLPLALLVAFGAYSLQQDRKLVDADAKNRCSRAAQDIASQLETMSLFETSSVRHDSIVIDSTGSLVSIGGSTNRTRVMDLHPTDINVRNLSAEQSRYWQQAREAEFAHQPHAAVEAYRRFLETTPPKSFLPLAQYSLALEIVMTGAVFAEPEAILRQLETNRVATTEAGLPLHLLATLRRLTFAFTEGIDSRNSTAFTNLLVAICSNAVNEPSVASSMVLSKAAELERQFMSVRYTNAGSTPISSGWLQEWQRDEALREFYSAIKPALQAKFNAFWTKSLEWQEEPCLVTISPITTPPLASLVPLSDGSDDSIRRMLFGRPIGASDVTNYVVRWLPRSEVAKTLLVIQEQRGVTVPDFADVTYDVAGMRIEDSSEKGLFDTVNYDSSFDHGLVPVTIAVRITKRNVLYAHQLQRTLWFAALLVISGGAAAIGLFTARRGFHQQLRLNEMKSNFVSSVSHELRAPIASVRLLAEGLDRGAVNEPAKQKEYFRFIVQECRRLTGLIENVLDFSRIEQGRKQYHFEETDLNALVDQTVKLMQPSATERGIDLSLNSSLVNHHSSRICDGLAVQQALVNLVDNAIKHSPAGEKVIINLDVAPSSIEDAASCIRLSVTDHGPGIPLEEHQKIFERFYRRGSELRRETQGIGIGLTIVKHVAEAHGGRVTVDSAVGKGSKFTIELPNKLSSQTSAD